MDLAQVRLIIADYRLDVKLPDQIFRYGDKFEKMSLTYWALDELENYVLSHPNGDPIDLVNSFMRKMTEYMYAHPKTTATFFVAVDVAQDIHEILLCSK